MKLKLGIPKGSLQDATVQLFARAGFNIYVSSRSYFPSIDDPGHRVHADPRAGNGALRLGRRARRRPDRPGLDCRARARRRPDRRARERSPISFTRSRASARSAGCSPRRRIRAIQVARRISKARRSPPSSCARRGAYFERQGVKVNVEFSWGATEVKPPVLADAIVEATETGSTLRANRLRDSRHDHGVEHAAHRQQDGARRQRGSGPSSRTSRCC